MTNWSWLLPHFISVAVLTAFVWLMCLGLKNRPAWRHALWLVVLIKMVTPTFLAWPWSVNEIAGHLLEETEVIAVDEPALAPVSSASELEPFTPATVPLLTETGEFTISGGVVAEALPLLTTIDLSNEPIKQNQLENHKSFIHHSQLPASTDGETLSRVTIEAKTPITTQSPAIADPVRTLELMESGLRFLLGLWISGSALLVMIQIRRVIRQRKIVMQGEPASQELVELVETVSGELNVRPVGVSVVGEIGSPFLWCLGRPMLVWPESMTDEATLQQSQGIIAHELAHIRRRDHWTAWLELAAGVVWWWNPLFWFVRRRLRESAEMACDAVALNLYDDRKAYAEMFLMLSSNRQSGAPSPVLGVSTGPPASFERRIAMMMSDRVSGTVSVWGILAIICLAAVALPSLSVGEDVPIADPASPIQHVAPHSAALIDETTAKLPGVDDDQLPEESSVTADGLRISIPAMGPRPATFDWKTASISPDAETTDDLLPERSGLIELSVGIASNESPAVPSKPETLDGVWLLKKTNLKQNPVEVYIQIFDTQNSSVTTFTKHRTTSSTNTNRFALDANSTPHQLTTYGDNILKQLIFEVSEDRLKVAYFSKSNLARPKSFDDSRTEAGTLTVLEFQRIDQPSDRVPPKRTDSPNSTGLSSLLRPRVPSASSNTYVTHPNRHPATAATPSSITQEAIPKKTLATITQKPLPEFHISPDEKVRKLQQRLLELEVESADAAYRAASSQHEDQARLSKKGYVSTGELQRTQAELRQTELQLERAKIMLQMFQLQAKRIDSEDAALEQEMNELNQGIRSYGGIR